LKRSNRLVLLVGVFLAIVAFVGILLLLQQPPTQNGEDAVTTGRRRATANIPLSTRIRADQVEAQDAVGGDQRRLALPASSQVIGQVARPVRRAVRSPTRR
jgi:hypothetical protein